MDSVCTTPDGKYVITGSLDETARVWSLDDGMMVQSSRDTAIAGSVCTTDGKHVITGSHDETARVWLLEDGTMVQELKGHGHGVTSVCTTGDFKHVITGSRDKTARIWSLADGAMVQSSRVTTVM